MNLLNQMMSYDKTKGNQEKCNCAECVSSENVELKNQTVEYPKLSEEEIEQIISERYLNKDEKTKTFKETNDFARAKHINVIIPESWYCILKNPAPDNVHPETAKAMASPGLRIGKKINVVGNDSFSLCQQFLRISGHLLFTDIPFHFLEIAEILHCQVADLIPRTQDSFICHVLR